MRPLLLTLCCVAFAATAGAQNMPAPEEIHGKGLPAAELASGTVTVRVVREAIGNNIAGQQVRVVANGRTLMATTDDLGRAEFNGLTPGAELHAEATVDGEALRSDDFRVPQQGGLRVILVAGIARAAERRKEAEMTARAAPAVKGVVTLGGNTRIIAEFQNDALFFFYQLDIVNNARAPVDIGGPLQLELPRRAAGATLMEDSPRTATINGRFLVVEGPFAPGTTTVNVQFQLRYPSSDVTITQRWPVAVEQLPVFIEKLGNVTFTSPQLQPAGDRVAPNGTTFAAAAGRDLAAGSDLVLQFSNLPRHGQTAAYVAVGLALGVIGLGIWLSLTARRGADAVPGLVARRENLLARVADLDLSRRAGTIADDRYLARRQRLIAELEDVYHEIDLAGGRPQGGDEGAVA